MIFIAVKLNLHKKQQKMIVIDLEKIFSDDQNIILVFDSKNKNDYHTSKV
jgi:hypothetical protein